MVALTDTIKDITGEAVSGDDITTAFVRSPTQRPSFTGQGLVSTRPVAISDAGEISLDLEPGPAVLVVLGPSFHDTWELFVEEGQSTIRDAVAAVPGVLTQHEVSVLRTLLAGAEDAADTAGSAAGEATSAAQQVGQDRTLVQQIRDLLEEAYNDSAAGFALPPRLTESALNAIYADKAGTVATAAGQNATHLWMPPEQSAQPGLASWTAQQFLDGYEALRSAAPEYVTRQQIGLDAEGKPIWAYFFTPAAYENTVLTINQHGYEKVAIWSNMRFAEMLVNDWATSPRLAAFRARTRLVVVPFVTWKGVDSSSRTNFNGVDLNRNWDWKWEASTDNVPGTETYKGTAPFSEPETQALRDFIGVLDAQGGLNAVLDMHSVGFTQQAEPYYVYFGLPDREIGKSSWAVELASEIAPGLPRYLNANTLPKATSWIQAQGIRSLTTEYYQSFGESGLDATNIRYGIRSYANTIMRAAELPSLRTVKAAPGTIVRTFDYASGTGPNVFIAAGTTTTTQEIVELRHEFQPPCAGIILWTGFILFGQGTAGRVYLQPVAGSDSLKSWWKTGKKDWDTSYLDLANAADRIVFPFSISRPVTDSSSDIWPFRLALHASGNGTTPPQVIRYQSTMVFIPAESPDRFERWTATGRSGEGAMQYQTGL